MHPAKQNKWRCGPLEVWERHFRDPHDDRVHVQWALVLEEILVVVEETVAKTILSGMEKIE